MHYLVYIFVICETGKYFEGLIGLERSTVLCKPYCHKGYSLCTHYTYWNMNTCEYMWIWNEYNEYVYIFSTSLHISITFRSSHSLHNFTFPSPFYSLYSFRIRYKIEISNTISLTATRSLTFVFNIFTTHYIQREVRWFWRERAGARGRAYAREGTLEFRRAKSTQKTPFSLSMWILCDAKPDVCL